MKFFSKFGRSFTSTENYFSLIRLTSFKTIAFLQDHLSVHMNWLLSRPSELVIINCLIINWLLSRPFINWFLSRPSELSRHFDVSLLKAQTLKSLDSAENCSFKLQVSLKKLQFSSETADFIINHGFHQKS